MKYMGGKSRIAKDILPIILKNRKLGQYFCDIFCGGGGILDKVSNPRIANDSNKYVVSLLEGVSNGWIPPKNLSEEEYYTIKSNPEKYMNELVGFAAIPCSYAAKWWGGFGRGTTAKGVDRNYALEAHNHLIKQGKLLEGVEFFSLDYREVKIPENSIIFCDPPYAGTTSYKSKFNHEEFWQWADKISYSYSVFVTEYHCPLNNWKSVWQKEINSSLTKETGSKKGVEKLWVRDENYGK